LQMLVVHWLLAVHEVGHVAAPWQK
jgi:hypothetical protein